MEPDGDEYSAEWRELFKLENISLAYPRDDGEPSGRSPERARCDWPLGARCVVQPRTTPFPSCARSPGSEAGYVVAGGIHEHDSPTLLACIRCRDAADARLVQGGEAAFGGTLHLHGDLVFARAPTATRGADEDALSGLAQRLETLAEGRPLGAELVLGAWDEDAFLEAKKRLGVDLPTVPRLFVAFYQGDAAADAGRALQVRSPRPIRACSGAPCWSRDSCGESARPCWRCAKARRSLRSTGAT